MTMSISSAPPLPGGGRAFTLAAWNIRCGRNAGMTSAAKGLEQMGVGLAVLMETKLTDDCYTCLASGFKILALKATSHNQGEIALLWKENHLGYEVESAQIATPNFLTFQLVTGDERFYCMGIYIPPTDTMGVEDCWAAWEACPEGCIPLALGNLNINFSDPQNEREETICNLLNDINLVDTLRLFKPHQPCKTINPGTGDLAAEEGREDTLFATRLYFCAQKGRQAIAERRVLVATISRLGPPSRHWDHPHREEAIEGVSKETAGIPTTSTLH
jgi:hypothetical protein